MQTFNVQRNMRGDMKQKGLHTLYRKRLNAQSALSNETTSFHNAFMHKTNDRRNSKVATTNDESIIATYRDIAYNDDYDIHIFRSYRRDLRTCERDMCDCICKCHTGSTCDVEDEIARTHTHNHKSHTIVKYTCLAGSNCEHVDNLTHKRERVEVFCHDSIMSEKTLRRFHMRHSQ